MKNPISSMSLPASSAEPLAAQPVPDEWVRWLFDRLAAVFGAKLADSFAGTKLEIVRREWAAGLQSFSDAEVERGLAACRTQTRGFAPNLAEFLAMCRPALDPEFAWIEAEKGMASHHRGVRFAWSHPAVYWAAREMQTELRGSTFAACRKRWTRLMQLEWEKGAWASPPDPTRLALPAASSAGEHNPALREAAQARIQRFRDELVLRFARREES